MGGRRGRGCRRCLPPAAPSTVVLRPQTWGAYLWDGSACIFWSVATPADALDGAGLGVVPHKLVTRKVTAARQVWDTLGTYPPTRPILSKQKPPLYGGFRSG